MRANHQAGHRALHLAPVAGIMLVLAGCVADESQNYPVSGFSSGPVQPRLATYDCGNDSRITVESMGRAVHLIDPEGTSYDLPASPPTQGSRFGEGSVALVVEGGEALWMKAGREPVTCRQG